MSKIKYLVLLLTFSASAAVYVPNGELNTRTSSDYQVDQKIDVKVLSVLETNSETSFAKVLLNGAPEVVTVKKLSSQLVGYGEYTANYDAYIKTDVLEYGSYCDESEKVQYVVNFDMDEERDPHAPISFSVKSVKAVRTYFYDICHDFDPEVETLNYSKK